MTEEKDGFGMVGMGEAGAGGYDDARVTECTFAVDACADRTYKSGYLCECGQARLTYVPNAQCLALRKSWSFSADRLIPQGFRRRSRARITSDSSALSAEPLAV
jgi:hypothetical protein